MTDSPLDESDVMRVLELANNHLEEAENILWETSTNARSDESAAALEDLTKQVWDIQHQIHDLERELEREDVPDKDDDFVYRGQ